MHTKKGTIKMNEQLFYNYDEIFRKWLFSKPSANVAYYMLLGLVEEGAAESWVAFLSMQKRGF